jgi:hypothetical protein
MFSFNILATQGRARAGLFQIPHPSRPCIPPLTGSINKSPAGWLRETFIQAGLAFCLDALTPNSILLLPF